MPKVPVNHVICVSVSFVNNFAIKELRDYLKENLMNSDYHCSFQYLSSEKCFHYIARMLILVAAVMDGLNYGITFQWWYKKVLNWHTLRWKTRFALGLSFSMNPFISYGGWGQVVIVGLEYLHPSRWSSLYLSHLSTQQSPLRPYS